MKGLYLATICSTILSPAVANNYGDQGLVDVLIANGFNDFAAGVQASFPDLLEIAAHRNDITVWAPLDGSVLPSENTTASPMRLLKRAHNKSSIYEYHFTHDSEFPLGTPRPKHSRKSRRHLGMPDSNVETLVTFLQDPEYVNLGDDEPGRIVSNYAFPQPGKKEATIEITSGGGDVANVVCGPYKYDNGIIYGVNKYFTLPQPLIPTLTTLGLTCFRDAIVDCGKEDTLSDTPAVTVFAYQNPDSGTEAPNLAEYTVSGYLGFLSELVKTTTVGLESDAGTNLQVTFSHGRFFVNGVKIIKSDIMVKNGVVHLLETFSGLMLHWMSAAEGFYYTNKTFTGQQPYSLLPHDAGINEAGRG